MTKDRDALLPCPMCGNKAEWKHVHGRLYLRCSQCRLGYDPQDYGGNLGTTQGCWTRAQQPCQSEEPAQPNLEEMVATVLAATTHKAGVQYLEHITAINIVRALFNAGYLKGDLK